MISKIRVILLLLTVVAVSFSQNSFILQPGTVVIPVEGDKAKQMIMTEDDYTSRLSKFDLQSKTQRKDSVTLADYLNYSAEQVVKWENDEMKIIGEVVSSTGNKIKSLALNIKMPDTIFIIKSTMANEGGADGYTRLNYIVLKENLVGRKSTRLENLFAHELFHVISRNNPEMSEKIYNTIGFRKTNDVPYPPEIADLRISNPDAPLNNYYITLEYNGKPIEAMLVLFAREPYKGGSFFAYVQIGLMAVEGDAEYKKTVYAEGKPLILKVKDVKGFYEQIGKNTDYIFHAEELSADHFELMLDKTEGLPNPELIEAMKNVMR